MSSDQQQPIQAKALSDQVWASVEKQLGFIELVAKHGLSGIAVLGKMDADLADSLVRQVFCLVAGDIHRRTADINLIEEDK